MSTTETFTTQELFRALNGRVYSSYQDFDAAVRDVFDNHRTGFPVGYSHRQAIAWARRNGWVGVDQGRLRVQL
jgi:hypothetical protein